MKNLPEILKKENWSLGVRAGDTLLVYSLRCEGENKYIKKFYGKKFTQWRMLVPKGKGRVRAISTTYTEKFHNNSKKVIIKNPRLLLDKIVEDENLLSAIAIKAKNTKTQNDFLKVIDLLGKHYFLFFLCSSYGMTLFENKKEARDKKLAEKVLKIHDNWRSAIFVKEMKILNSFDNFLKTLAKKSGIKNIEDLFYLEIKEFKKGLKQGFEKNTKNKINKRKKSFAYIFLGGKKEVIEDTAVLRKMEDWFFGGENFSKKTLRGLVAYKKNDKVVGKVKIIEKPKLKAKIDRNTILVTLQITPNFIPIVRNFSAIIADEGGITSHAAIISREFKIPCIVGTQNATKFLKSGNLIEMNMRSGKVILLN